MKNLIKCLTLTLFLVCCCSCMQRIDAGHEGIKVNLYGSDKGVDDVELVTGAVWYFAQLRSPVYDEGVHLEMSRIVYSNKLTKFLSKDSSPIVRSS